MPLFTIFCHTYVPRINKKENDDDDDFINLTLNCVQQHNRHHAVCFISFARVVPPSLA